jgi:hypothetical protein
MSTEISAANDCNQQRNTDRNYRVRQISQELFHIFSAQNKNETRKYRCFSNAGDNAPNIYTPDRIEFDTTATLNNSLCEYLEVEFIENNATTYAHLHSHISLMPNNSHQFAPWLNNQTTDDRYRPDVLILVFDSVSMSNGLRTLQKTFANLQQNYSAIIFPHLNKLGKNSFPNAHALLNGKSWCRV